LKKKVSALIVSSSSTGEEGGDCDTVDLRGASEGEEGPNTVAPPHPNLRKK
jgi:hypothetical protein